MSYDARREPHEFFAEERSEAVAKACQFFGVDEDELAITEYQPGEVHGSANRTVVVAMLRDRPAVPASDRGDRERGGRRERGDRGERGGRRERGDRGDRERGGRRERGESRRDRERDRDREPRAAREEEAPSEPSVGEVQGTLSEIGTFVCGVIERMDLGPFEISEAAEDDLLVFQVRGAAAPRLAGKDGRTVDALQLIANQAAGRLDEEPPRVVLDVEGDADARENRLTKLAQRVARRARETGRTVRLDPMSGRDRRTIHLALRDEEDIATMSTGEGRYRQVLVVPEGAPEFDDAVAEAERAAQRD
ncbi:MAG: R3H domain-containing nucleic acid-binding protein [Myxococcota bacterium]|nr:R3H domain-containing nucleic acid-binding protein [Myxococcota bacterium]